MVVYESIYHIIFQFGPKSEKVDGENSGVHLRTVCQSKNFFSGPGTCVPLETSATSQIFKKSVRGILLYICHSEPLERRCGPFKKPLEGFLIDRFIPAINRVRPVAGIDFLILLSNINHINTQFRQLSVLTKTIRE